MTEHSGSPLRTYTLVFFGLMILTIATVLVAYVDLGSFNIIVALGIASIKAALVMLFFMHLIHTKFYAQALAFVSFLFLALLILVTLIDFFSRDLFWEFMKSGHPFF